jgi:ribosomal protein L30
MKKESIKNSSEEINVVQIRSAAGRDKKFKATLSALGLGKIGDKRSYKVNPGLCGMLRKVSHIVEVG